MPKEQPCQSENSLCATSSKNAKDKSNSTTLLAIRNSNDSGGRGSRCSSEKDSGYSDGSDWQQTDVEDQRCNKSQCRGGEHAKTSQAAQSQEVEREAPGNPTLMPAGRELSPIHTIKNTVLKQTSSSGSAHVMLLQQPSLLLATLQLHKSSSRKSSATGKKATGPYLPILNSYPRIAPHPSKKPPDKSSSSDESQNLSKRVCTEHKSEGTPVTRSLPEQHLYKQPKLAVSASGLPCSSSTRDSLSSCSATTVTSSQVSPSGSSLHTTSSLLLPRGLHRTGVISARHRRFLNTVEILKQSGLLDITLRTKELLRQSNATERQIAQVRQHTELLCQVASDPSCSLNGIRAWEHLHRSMAESGSYPNLKTLQNLQIPCYPDSASQPESNSTGDSSDLRSAGNSAMPSHFPTTVPDLNQNHPVPQRSHSGQDREPEASEKVTFTPPDSSTG